jgi:coiled-coil domain-containing protein 55
MRCVQRSSPLSTAPAAVTAVAALMPQVQEMYAAALAEDPNAFDYDGVYDSIQQEKAAPKAQDKVARQPKYIANLLEQAQLRKREQDITTERRLVRCWLVCTVDQQWTCCLQ